MASLMNRLLRAGEGKIVRELQAIANQVNALEPHFEALSDAELQAVTPEFKQRLADGETLDDLLPEAFAATREAARRVLGQRHYDVQIMGGAALHKRYIAEMRTGEGKTLVATLPAYLNGLTGRGVHVITVNDYLARRDSAWMGRVHRFLGLTVDCISPEMRPAERRAAYACDITYGTNNEFGFDYLRDNMAMRSEDCVQRGHYFAIVDEVDSILIDEARTPLIISGPSDQPTKWYMDFARLVNRMTRDVDYEVDEKKRTIGVLEPGIEKVEDNLGIDNLYESANTPLVQFLNNAIKAKELFHRDKDYIVSPDGEVLIVDEHTGRVLSGRRYNEGMHQAIEAKEGVEIKQENQTLATITLQNFFRMYEKLSGMTGTAMTEAAEFDKTYKLGVVPVPTHRPNARVDQHDLIFRTRAGKYSAVVEDIGERHRKGQPVLVGTASVHSSEELSRELARAGIRHEVLNAKQHEREAHIVAAAGRLGAVTVATNMAGRGTDIMLGGNAEFVATEQLEAEGIRPESMDPVAYQKLLNARVQLVQPTIAEEHAKVVALGGLYVLGTERHESRRIDNQLRGRSGRQGDPGESRFYLSLQDELMRRFGGAVTLMDRAMAGLDENQPIENKSITKSIARAQAAAEGQFFEIRKDVLKYDDVMNQQRRVIYAERRRVLDGEDLRDQMRSMITDVVGEYVDAATAEGFPEMWDLDRLWEALRTLYPVGVTVAEVEEECGGRDGLSADFLSQRLKDDVMAAYDRREAEFGADVTRQVERQIVLTVLDRRWREHLYEMDYLREGIGLRAMAQRDPLVEYQREGFSMFQAMNEGIKEESAGLFFHVEVQVQQNEAAPVAKAKGFAERGPEVLQYSEPTIDSEEGVATRAERAAAAAEEGESAPPANRKERRAKNTKRR